MTTDTPEESPRGEQGDLLAGERLPGWLGYLAAIVIEAAITGGLLLVNPYLPLGRFPVWYFLSVGLIAYLFGIGPALLAFFISLLAFQCFFIPPSGRLWPIANTPLDWAAWIAFIVGVLVVALGMSRIRTLQRRRREALRLAEHELAERKQAEEALRESEERYRAVSSAAFEGIAIHDGSRILEVNDAVARMFGYEPPELLEKPPLEFYAAESHEAIRKHIAESSREPYEVVAIRKNGTTFIAEIRGRKVTYKGQPARAVAVRDITERKQAEEALRESERRFRIIADFTYDWEYWLSENGEFIYISPSCERMTGYSSEEFVREPSLLTSIVHPGDKDRVVDHLKACVPPHREYPLDYRIVKRDGEVRWISHVCMPVCDEQGRCAGTRASNRDITERVKAEQSLAQERELLQAIINNIPVYLVIWDGRLQRFQFNEAFRRDTGWTEEDAAEGDFMAKGYPDPEYRREVEEYMQSLQPGFRDLKTTTKDGRELVVAWANVGLSENRSIGIGVNITERKQVEEALRETEHDLSRAQTIARIGSWRLDVRRNELVWSDEVYHIFGVPIGTPLTYESFLSFIHPEDREYVDREWTAALEGKPYGIEHRICVGDSVKWVRETAELEFDEQGQLIGGFGTVQDITELVRLRQEIEEALERERHFSRLLQRALLPPAPEITTGYRMGQAYIPAYAGREIGGDFYDVFPAENGNQVILIGDVSGKGLEAASMAANTRATIRAFAYELTSAGEALTHANAVLSAQQLVFGSFVTVFLAIIEPDTGKLCYANAGHPPAMIYHSDSREIESLAFGQPPVGLVPGEVYEQWIVQLNPDDKIIFYTDGLSEARHDSEMFGEEGVERVIMEHGMRTPDDLVGELVSAATKWAEGQLRDDTAVVVVEREPQI